MFVGECKFLYCFIREINYLPIIYFIVQVCSCFVRQGMINGVVLTLASSGRAEYPFCP